MDTKYVYQLRRCAECRLLFMYPYETASELHRFYQRGYNEPGLITELPDDATLHAYKTSNFAGSPKDFSAIVQLLFSLGLGPGSRILDYGASWGYATYQLKRAGFSCDGFEISEPRAAFGRSKLDVPIYTDLAQLPGQYDCVYSSHVIEHTPDPRLCLTEQLQLLSAGGFVVAHLPNGSRDFMDRSYSHFHHLWGKVHPVMIDDIFLRHSFAEYPIFLSSKPDVNVLGSWDKRSHFQDGTLSGDELFFVIHQRAPDLSVDLPSPPFHQPTP